MTMRLILRRAETRALRWEVLHDGKLLVSAAAYPMLEGAVALAALGLDPATPITMRHEGSAFDSFVPAPLAVWLAAADRRAERLARKSQRRPAARSQTAKSRSEDQRPPERASAILCDAAPEKTV